MQQIKHRKKLTAIFLALLSLIYLPGIGQLFGGRLWRSFLLLGFLLALALGYAAGAMNYIYSAVPTYLAFFVVWAYMAYDTYRLNVDKKGVKLYWYNKWYCYVLFAIIFHFINLIIVACLSGFHTSRIMNEKFSPTLQAGDIVMSKMNYGHSAGIFIRKVDENPFYNNPIPVIIFSSPKYTVGSFVLFKEPFSQENKTFVGKVVSINGDDPQDMIMVSINKDVKKIISRSDIKGKLLYILWSRNKSRIGARVD